MKKLLMCILIFAAGIHAVQSQTPSLTGYWHNWQDFNSPYIPLTQTDTSYNIIEVSFVVPLPGTTYNMSFIPDVVSQQTFIAQVDSMKSRNKKVLISLGGANSLVVLNDTNQMNIFISSMMNIISTYHFDGIDIDLEGSSITVSGGTITNPVDAKIINLINGIKKLMLQFRSTFNKKMMLTMAPETAFVQGGISAYGSIWGAYLPVIHALRDSIDVLQVQLYNSGSMYGIDGNIYYQGTADFILSQTEAVIQGFNTSGGYFQGLRPDQVSVGLPACTSAAGGGYTHPDTVKAAILYLLGKGPKPAYYTRLSTYPSLRGMMTWSINWDANSNCHPKYEYARNFDRIFKIPITGIVTQESKPFVWELFDNYPNPFNSRTRIIYSLNKAVNIQLKVFDISGKLVTELINEHKEPGKYFYDYNASELTSGVYFCVLSSDAYSVTKKLILMK